MDAVEPEDQRKPRHAARKSEREGMQALAAILQQQQQDMEAQRQRLTALQDELAQRNSVLERREQCALLLVLPKIALWVLVC